MPIELFLPIIICTGAASVAVGILLQRRLAPEPLELEINNLLWQAKTDEHGEAVEELNDLIDELYTRLWDVGDRNYVAEREPPLASQLLRRDTVGEAVANENDTPLINPEVIK